MGGRHSKEVCQREWFNRYDQLVQMGVRKNLDIVRSFRQLSRISPLLVAGIGLIVLLGWLVDSAALKSIHPGFVTMKANTAFGFVLTGASLSLLTIWQRMRKSLMIARAMIILLFALGFITWLQYLLGFDAGFDDLFFPEEAQAAWP